jgi:hypothetical protein
VVRRALFSASNKRQALTYSGWSANYGPAGFFFPCTISIEMRPDRPFSAALLLVAIERSWSSAYTGFRSEMFTATHMKDKIFAS